MDAAIGTEALKLWRSPVARTGWLAIVLGVPALTAGLTTVARVGGDSQLAVKAAAMLPEPGWAGFLGVVGQVSSVAVLLAVGFVTSWCFGREFVDGTIGGLFAVAVPRRRIAAAKFAVLLAWSIAACVVTVLVAIVAGFALGLGAPDGPGMLAAGRVLIGGTLMAALPRRSPGWPVRGAATCRRSARSS